MYAWAASACSVGHFIKLDTGCEITKVHASIKHGNENIGLCISAIVSRSKWYFIWIDKFVLWPTYNIFCCVQFDDPIITSYIEWVHSTTVLRESMMHENYWGHLLLPLLLLSPSSFPQVHHSYVANSWFRPNNNNTG